MTKQQVGYSRLWIMAGARKCSFLQNIQIGSGAHPSSCQWVHVVLSRTQSMRLTTHHHLIMKLQMSGVKHPLPVCLHGVYKDKFTFLFPPSAGWMIEAVSSSKTFMNFYRTIQQRTSDNTNVYCENIWFVMHPCCSLCSHVIYIMCTVWT